MLVLRKSAAETLEFQTLWGLRQLGYGEGSELYNIAKMELGYIMELDLAGDLLCIKRFVDGVRQNLGASVSAGAGDFTESAVCLALGISVVENIEEVSMSKATWERMIARKLLAVCYPESVRNDAVAWAGQNGFATSTYLGRPIIKTGKIFLVIDRIRNE